MAASLKISVSTLRRELSELQKAEIVKRVGSDKKGHWIIANTEIKSPFWQNKSAIFTNKTPFFWKKLAFFSERLALSISGLRECAKKNGVFSKKIAVFFWKIFVFFLGFSNVAVPERGFTSFRGTFLRSESVPTSIFRQSG